MVQSLSDLWQRISSVVKELENIIEEVRVIKDSMKIMNHYPTCCLQIDAEGKWKCSRYHLPEEEFMVKCKACRKEIEKILESRIPELIKQLINLLG